MIEAVLVPHNRVMVIKDGETRNKISKSLNVKISFEDNSVLIEGEGLEVYQAKSIVKAVGRGFSPENAFRLLEEENSLETIELKQFNDNRLKVIKARLIGTNGKTWRMIESFSGCSLSIFGKTVSLIGSYEQLEIAREAVRMIVKGSNHSSVYGFLFRSKS